MTAFVINCARPLTMCVDDILDLARRIENRGRLPIDILINNTNLADETTPQLVMEGENTVLECADRMGISRVITSGKQNVLEQCTLRTPKMEVSRYMAPEWMVDTP